MIKPKKKICVTCGNEDYIFSKNRCKKCTSIDYAKKTQDNTKTKPNIPPKRKYKPTGELLVFQSVFIRQRGICAVTGRKFASFEETSPINYMHILSKGAYPSLRLLDRNILLVVADVHDKYDNRGNDKLYESYPKEKIDYIFELKQDLKSKYYNV